MTTAVLISAGLDSVVLAASEAHRAHEEHRHGVPADREEHRHGVPADREERRPGVPADSVQPVYVRAGLAWETPELAALERLLAMPPFAGRVAPLVQLTFSVTDLYPATHWALRGNPPSFDTPDEDVYLTGRNVALLSKAAIYCAQHRIDRIAIGPLAGNPFPDATPEFFRTLADALSLGLAHPLTIDAPFVTMEKRDVIRLGVELGVPLDLTLSCMSPQEGRHCGRCSKCRERRDGFSEAGVADPTGYATPPPR